MSTRESVLAALFARLSDISGPRVLRGAVLPARIPPEGILIMRDGDPGEPDIDLSPLTYNYDHQAEVEVLVQLSTGQDAAFDALAEKIGQQLEADRTLGGLCDWSEGTAPVPIELTLEGGEPMKAATVSIRLVYSTTHPL